MNMKKYLFFLLLLGGIALEVHASRLKLINNSSWRLRVEYTKRGQAQSSVPLEPQEEGVCSAKDLGDVNEIDSIAIQTYGKLWGRFGTKEPINLTEAQALAKSDPDKDVTIRISVGGILEIGKFIITTELSDPSAGGIALTSQANLVAAFPTVVQVLKEGRSIETRHVLGLEPNYTTEDLNKAYKNLSLQWHPDKNPGNKEFASAVFKVLRSAYEALRDGTPFDINMLFQQQQEVCPKQ